MRVDYLTGATLNTDKEVEGNLKERSNQS